MPAKKITNYFAGKKPKALAGNSGRKERQAYLQLKGTVFPRKKGGKKQEQAKPKRFVFSRMSQAKRQTRKEFLTEKKYWLKALNECVSGKSAYGPVHPLVRKALFKLNSLPFVYTFDSQGDRVCKQGRSSYTDTLRIEEAKKENKVNFVSSFISIVLDASSPESRFFAETMQKWGKKNFPNSHILFTGGDIEVQSHQFEFELPSTQIDERIAESEKFMKGLEDFVDRYKAFRKKAGLA